MWSGRRWFGLGYTESKGMENRLKERLTGAAILVALIVLLVPEMFHGQRPDEIAGAASSGEGPPLRSYTIDLSNGPARTAPLQSTPASIAASLPAEAAEETSPSATPPAAAAPVATAPVARVPVAVRPAAAPPGGAHTAVPGWSVQLGLFASHDNAERLQHTAQGKGFAAILSDRDARGFYSVHVTGLPDRAAALALQQRLRDQDLPAAVVAPAAAGAPAAQ